MREARKRKSVTYAESTSSGLPTDEDADSRSDFKGKDDSDVSIDESMDVDSEEVDDLSSDEDDDSGLASEDDDKKGKKPPKKAATAKKTTTAGGSKIVAQKTTKSAAAKDNSSSKKMIAGGTNTISRTTPNGPASNSVARPTSNIVSTGAPSSSTLSSSNSNITAVGADITNGPPVTTDAGAKKLITQYMRQQNRPYSAQQVFDNLHKRIPRATLERVLGALSSPGEGLICKEYGKAKLYFVDQNFLPTEKSPEQLQELQRVVIDLQDDLKSRIQEENERKKQIAQIKAQPNDEELDGRIADLEGRLQSKRQRIQQLQELTLSAPQLPVRNVKGGKSVSGGPMSLEQATTQYNLKRKGWLERKALCMNAIDVLSEAMNKKRQELLSILDIETDEMAGVELPAKL